MNESQFQKCVSILKGIDDKLSILISLQKSLITPPSLGNEEKTVLKLCNGKNSVEDMMKIANKKRNNIEVTLSHLKKKGIIKSTKINDKHVYVKI